ncbi:hypothetical protein FG167_05825 [Lacinutrix sp. WUR7]|uniref:hypothetical protein n=1 Tax=Lacinutrix sp. WUR7 TaxID=2653681 RepID=UPI00193E9714|nr:hypothetical protein [Lacinutrix sp. WUR7]QRM88771.1 hypothetical protein FG167_05825 [Lacinutrix sp. WUR7]
MKKILVVLLFIIISSCSVTDDSPRIQTEFLPIESVNMPDAYRINQTYTIYLTYYRPSNCHAFNGIYSHINSNENTIAIVSDVYTNNNCQEIITEAEASFNFRPTEIGTYIFKFWHGENTINNVNEDLYLDYEIEVVE